MQKNSKWFPGGTYEKFLKGVWILLFIAVNPPIVNWLNYEQPFILGIPFLPFWLLSCFVLFGISIIIGALKLKLPIEEEEQNL